ncbi:MAG TPA: glycosyltransferase family 2 protein, partial [Oligoflexia bacterium]|nr:glycosyltransferase family 2 protein [Oligoflexia bacterium]
MPENQALVSIGLPVYNGEKFLRRALNSLTGQDYGNIELIISDNDSTDSTAQICGEFLAHDRRIRYYRCETNIGMAANFVRVLNLARGDYFMWAACDDWWDKRFVSCLLQALMEHPDHGV